MEHGVGGMGAGHSPAFGGKRGNRGRDDLDLFAAELAAFAGMRVEAGHGEPRLGDPEAGAEARAMLRGHAIR